MPLCSIFFLVACGETPAKRQQDAAPPPVALAAPSIEKADPAPAIAAPSPPSRRGKTIGFPRQYDLVIRNCTQRFEPLLDWRLRKAQWYQESRLKPDAVSPVGAEGIAQFMPATAREIWAKLGYGVVDRRLVEPSACAGSYYMDELNRGWTSRRPWEDREMLAEASYNAGKGNILKAQKACGGKLLYAEIMPCLKQVTGDKNAAETEGYAPGVWTWFRLMLAEG